MASDDEEMEINKEDIEDDTDDESKGDDDDNDNDDDSTSEDSPDEQIDDSKQETELVAHRDIVQSNPYNYQAYIDYINLARQYGNLEHLRFARQKMSEMFPLTQQLWLDWIRDEMQLLISNTEENKELIQLFERALNDYLSVMIWIEYVQYRLPYYVSLNSIEELRNLFERGLSSCALHITEGNLLWAAYIETEKAILDGILLKYNQNNTNNNDLKEKILQHVDYILTLYRRQLSIPLRGMDTIYYKDYNEFCQQYKEYLPTNYIEKYDLILKNDFDHAIQQLEKCEKFEQELDATKRSVATYRKYIQFEKEPARIQCLYERAIVDNCLDGVLWLSYIDFAEEHLSSTTILQSIFERSLRNCPWVATLWVRYTEYMELTTNTDHSQLKKIYDRALNSDPTNLISFVDIQLAYFQYRRRHYHQELLLLNNQEQCELLKEEIRHICEYACDQYQELFLSSNDPNLFLKYNGQLELYWIHLEIKSFHSIEHARQIWNGRTLMNKTHNQMISNLWKIYYYMEINYGDEKHARKVLYRALNHIQTMDYPLIICDILLEHEKKYGTIQQLKETKDKLRQIKNKIVQIEKPKRQQQQQQQQQQFNKNNKKQINKGKQKEPKEKSTKVSNNKMDTTASSVQSNGNITEQQQQSPRKRKLSPEETQNVKKKPQASTIDSEGFKIPLPPPPPPSLASSSTSSSMISTTKDIDHLNTVFIANLAFDTTEDAIRQVLSSAGEIKEIRLVKHEWSGKSKGYGYVDFVTSEGYRQALKLDRTPINDRPMYVSEYDRNKSTSNDLTKKFKYATTLEQNKLFISNLPFSLTKEQLQNLFIEKGFKIKDVRLVTHKSGKSKGLAYVEFNDPQEASQAILKFDGTDVDGHTIKVAISNPPQHKQPIKLAPTTQPVVSRAASLGEAPKSTGPRGKGHSQISLVPRKIATTNTKPTSQSTSTTTNTMTNDDFRKMLFSKK
ncbi:unnamed protein product [Rotaria sordida]|uniref:RRM domain-containing protein n=1 Tax=Rotaria sordida TaxID=392033 RepID=A0A818MYH7_9BILA|nr:unnamed protein product [Rotaria sordida]CAF1036791.1 unnamed protein product [Rotaria sordida]CAF3596769.1 unnamed protein product [Rotaria sordida]